MNGHQQTKATASRQYVRDGHLLCADRTKVVYWVLVTRTSAPMKRCWISESAMVDARIAQNQFWVCLTSLNNTERMGWKHLTVSQGRLQRTWGLWRTITTVSVNAPFNLWCFVSKCGFWFQDTPLDLVVVSVSEVLSGSGWACRQRG